MTIKLPHAAKPWVDFAIHVVVGAVGFFVVLMTAVAISEFVKLIDGMVPRFVQKAAESAEVVLFGLDYFLFGIFVVSEALKLLRDVSLEIKATFIAWRS